MSKNAKFILIFLLGYVIYEGIERTFDLFHKIQSGTAVSLRGVGADGFGHILAYVVTSIPLFITIIILHNGHKNFFEKIGLSKGFGVGSLFAFIVTLPMLVGYALKFSLAKGLDIDTIIIKTISSAFFEEIIYRAFLFGMLYLFTRLGFLPSVLLSSIIFGMAHLYQSSDINESVGIFAITFLGSIIFSWVYAEWKFNLWTAIFLHCLMNLYWLIFDVDANALGGTYANIFRFSTIFLAIFGTILYKRKKKDIFEITRKTWWMKSKNYG